MNRKKFIRSAGSLLAATALPPVSILSASDKEAELVIIPPYLKRNDTIGIAAPAGYITLEGIQPAIIKMESWGYKIKTGSTIEKKDFTFGGTDEERAADFQQMLDDPKIKAIMCARGGYGTVRIIDRLKWEKFKLKPKWIIGFSDVTVFHSHLNRQFNIASIHSKMCNSFPNDWSQADQVQITTIESIHKALSGEKLKYSFAPNFNNRAGIAEGVLVGGNLKTLESLNGSVSDLKTDGKILFVEDTGEYLYSIDRMLWSLKRSGKLSRLKGLITGGIKVRTDADTEDFGRTFEQLVLEKVSKYKYPVCFDFPVGHQRNNYTLKCGVKHQLTVQQNICSLNESR